MLGYHAVMTDARQFIDQSGDMDNRTRQPWWKTKVPPWTSILLWSAAAMCGLSIGLYLI